MLAVTRTVLPLRFGHRFIEHFHDCTLATVHLEESSLVSLALSNQVCEVLHVILHVAVQVVHYIYCLQNCTIICLPYYWIRCVIKNRLMVSLFHHS